MHPRPKWIGALALVLGLAALLAAPADAASKAEKLLRRGIAAGDRGAVVSALEELGDQNDEKAAKLILKVALSADALSKGFSPADTNAIFDAAKRALAGMSDEEALQFVYSSANSHRDHRVRLVLLEVCGVKDGPDAESALVGGLGDREAVVAGLSARILGARKTFTNVDAVLTALIELLGKVEEDRRAPWQDVLAALVSITGEELDRGPDWEAWWKVQRGRFDPSRRPRKSGVSDTIRREAPKLFGKEILSKKVVFILDVSGSMALKDPSPEGGIGRGAVEPDDPDYGSIPLERMRMYRLKEAMVKAIKELPEDTEFTILTFASAVRSWKPKLAPATARNKANAVQFSEGMTPVGFTHTDTALERAFDVPDANTFYLFSDGIPQRSKGNMIPREEILDKVAQLNRLRKVKIYTIGFGEADADFMRTLAEQNGGDFTPVD